MGYTPPATSSTPTGNVKAVRRVRRTAGDITVTGHSPVAWDDAVGDNSLDLAVPAAVGDWVAAHLSGTWSSDSAAVCVIDVVSLNSVPTYANYWSGGTGIGTDYGFPSCWATPSAFTGFDGLLFKQIVAGDMFNGTQILLRPRVRFDGTSTTRTLKSNSQNPLIFEVINYGPGLN